MEISQAGLAIFCFAAFFTGVLLGAFYDLSAILPALGGKTFYLPLRQKLCSVEFPLIARKVKFSKTNVKEFTVGFSLFLHDLVFMSVAGIITALTVYRFNDGKWRFYALIFIVLGFALYRKFLRLPILALAEILRFLFKSIVMYTVYFIMKPIKMIAKKTKAYATRRYLKHKKNKIKKNIIKYSKKEKERFKVIARTCGCLTSEKKEEDKNDRKKQNNPLDDDPSSCSGDACNSYQSYAI